MPRLQVKQGGHSREVAITRETLNIGRTPENDLEIHDALISRRHSSIVCRDDRYYVYDLGSSNGTFVNRNRVETHPLSHGDVIRIGETEIVFLDENTAARPAMPQGGGPSGSQLMQHVDNIAESLQFNISEALSMGLTLGEIRKDTGDDRASRESKMFFILFQVGKTLSTAATLEEMLFTAVKLIFEVINAERGMILLCEEEGADPVPRLSYHRAAGKVDPTAIPISRTIMSQVIGQKVSVITSDALQDPRFMEGQSIIQYNIRSALCVPLWDEERVYGMIYVDNLVTTYAFTKEDLELLTAIANLVGIRIRQEETQAKLRQEEKKRDNLAKFFSPDMVDRIMARGGEVGQVEEREVSVVFMDVVASTRMAETRRATEVVGILNEFFRMAAEAVFSYKANLNKFIGDEVMALFNAPEDMPDHAAAAVRCCLALLEAVKGFNQEQPERRFDVRCAVNTGPAVTGYVGTPQCMEYTALGDVVNVAARLSKLPPVNSVVVGERTYKLVKKLFKAKDLGAIQLRGRGKSLHAYEITA